MKNKTIIIGHKSPDTDSICSAIAYTEFKRQKGETDIIAGRAGNINPQTNFVLKYFNEKPPQFFSDIFPRLFDVMVKDPDYVTSNTPILKAMKLFKEKVVRFLPVVDKNKKVLGSLSPIDLTDYFSTHVELETIRSVYSSVKNISISADAKILTTTDHKRFKKYNLFCGAMSKESFSKTISGYDPESLIVVVGDRETVIKSAILKKVSIIIVSGGFLVNESLIKMAKECGITLLVTPYDSAACTWLVKLSVPVSEFSMKNYLSFLPKTRTEFAKSEFVSSKSKGIIVSDEKGILQGVLTKSSFLSNNLPKLILVDHNEMPQSVDGAELAEIVEVIDHHRISGFKTVLPISFNVEPVGSTCTLIFEKFTEHELEISYSTAGLLFAGIISDTVTGRSPTTTKRDIDAMNALEDLTCIKRDAFSMDMFKASSIVGERPAKEVLLNDFKEFEIGGKKVGVGQVEVVGFNKFNSVKTEILKEMDKLREDKKFDMIGLMVTDITYEKTLFSVSADKDIIDSLGLIEYEKNIFDMKGVLSRKKQLIPHLCNALGG